MMYSMRKFVLVLAIPFLLIGCGDDDKSTEKETVENPSTEDGKVAPSDKVAGAKDGELSPAAQDFDPETEDEFAQAEFERLIAEPDTPVVKRRRSTSVEFDEVEMDDIEILID